MPSEEEIVNNFHRLYYENHKQTWGNTYWFGVPCLKSPFDLWIYQEIIIEAKPDLIIECGTCAGGSALFFGMLCSLLGHGRVITIDKDLIATKTYPNITYIIGNTISPQVVEVVKDMASKVSKVMVILDSDHQMSHVYSELQIYSPLVTEGCYLIVEDTNLNGHPVFPDFGPGPLEAVDKFLMDNKNFVQDRSREKFYFTQNAGGYLKKMSIPKLAEVDPMV